MHVALSVAVREHGLQQIVTVLEVYLNAAAILAHAADVGAIDDCRLGGLLPVDGLDEAAGGLQACAVGGAEGVTGRARLERDDGEGEAAGTVHGEAVRDVPSVGAVEWARRGGRKKARDERLRGRARERRAVVVWPGEDHGADVAGVVRELLGLEHVAGVAALPRRIGCSEAEREAHR